MRWIKDFFYATQLLLLLIYALPAFSVSYDSAVVEPKAVYGQEIRVIAYILNHKHYRKIELGDSLSSVILDAYIDKLDNNRTYFFRSDIESFESYRYILDDKTQHADVTPAYAIYDVFRKRYMERMKFVTKVIDEGFDYSLDEYYVFDRKDRLWPNSIEAMNTIWRKMIKSQALSLTLKGKTDEKVKEELRKRYRRFTKNVRQFNGEDVFSLYANALAEAYDPHTNYFSPQVSSVFKQAMSLSLEGIGARLQNDNDYTKVVGVIPGGPAKKSNKIHINDRIVGVGQGGSDEMVDIIGWRLSDVVEMIKGPKGTTVRLQILPAKAGIDGDIVEIQLVRDKIKLEDLAASKKVLTYSSGGNTRKFGVIALPSFYMDFEAYSRGEKDYRSTTTDVKKLIDSLNREGVDGIVMDLRNNGGGALSEAIDLTGLFIEKGPVVQVRDASDRVNIGADRDEKTYFDKPLVVLTNRFSASASEIFSGAIQDYERGIVVGEPTYGKGTVQTIVDLSRFIDTREKVGQLKVTFQKFYRITGSSTQNKGVIPDIVFPSAYDDNQYSERANPGALPWDAIQPTAFQRTSDVDHKMIARLDRVHRERMLRDTTLREYLDDIKELKKKNMQTRISLNEEKRRVEMKGEDALEQAEEPDEAFDEPLSADTLPQLHDEYLREAILVLDKLADRWVQIGRL